MKNFLIIVAFFLILAGAFNWLGSVTDNESGFASIYGAIQFVGGFVLLGLAGIIEAIVKLRPAAPVAMKKGDVPKQ